MENAQMCEKWGFDEVALEAIRAALSRPYTVQHHRRVSLMDRPYEDLVEMESRGLLPALIPGEDMVLLDREVGFNIVTNEGLDSILDVGLSGGTQITAWYVAISKTNTTPLSTHTYASPGYTEIAGSNVDESNRQAWTDGGVSSQSVDNSGSPAVYTASDSWTAYGAGLVGGGGSATTIADTAGGGTLYSSYLFAASKSMTASDTLTTTYTLGSADDGA